MRREWVWDRRVRGVWGRKVAAKEARGRAFVLEIREGMEVEGGWGEGGGCEGGAWLRRTRWDLRGGGGEERGRLGTVMVVIFGRGTLSGSLEVLVH